MLDHQNEAFNNEIDSSPSTNPEDAALAMSEEPLSLDIVVRLWVLQRECSD